MSNMRRRTTPQNGMQEHKWRNPSFRCESDALRRSRIHRRLSRSGSAFCTRPDSRVVRARQTCQECVVSPHPPLFAGLGGREAKRPTSRESSVRRIHVSPHTQACELRRKMACENTNGAILHLHANPTRIHRRLSRGGGAFCTRPWH